MLQNKRVHLVFIFNLQFSKVNPGLETVAERTAVSALLRTALLPMASLPMASLRTASLFAADGL